MKIVKWGDGTYSVRKWTISGYEWADLSERNSWRYNLWNECKGTLEECEKYILKSTIVEVIDTKNIRKLKKYTGELKEELALYSEAKELEAKVNELRKARGF